MNSSLTRRANEKTRDTLEHGSRWLWFKPDVIRSILQHRGSSLYWYTRDTGAVTLNPGWSGVHFGINNLGLINVYAKDIAFLPDWQQRVWVGANVAPDGKVSTELLDSQMRGKPADTIAPEHQFRRAYDLTNQEFLRKTGRALFRPHQASDELFLKTHRFRSLDRAGLFDSKKIWQGSQWRALTGRRLM